MSKATTHTQWTAQALTVGAVVCWRGIVGDWRIGTYRGPDPETQGSERPLAIVDTYNCPDALIAFEELS